MLHFQHIDYFWLLFLVPISIFLFLRIQNWKEKKIRDIGDPELVRDLIKGYSPAIFKWKFYAILISIVLCIVAVAGLVLPDKSQEIVRTGTDMMILLDVSNSMLAADVPPNRLVRAKQLISRVIDRNPGNQIGLIIFAGRAYLQMPLTLDHEAARMYVSAANPNDVPTQGTVIRDALQMAQAVFNPDEETFRSVLLISDGEDHDRDAISAAKDLANDGVMINTIGIGSPEGAYVPGGEAGQFKLDENGNRVVSKLNQEELKEIAKAGNGIYQLFTNVETVTNNLQSQLKGIEQNAQKSDKSYKSMKQFYWYFLLPALVFLIVEPFLKRKKSTSMRIVTALFLCLLTNNLFAQEGNRDIFRGNQLYKNQQFTEAINAYQKSISISKDIDIANFNTGNAFFKNNEPGEAIGYYDRIIKESDNKQLTGQAYYNKGVALQKMGRADESMDAYKNALLLNPEDEDSRQNLQLLLKEKQEQGRRNRQDRNEKEQPEQQKSSISRKDAEEKLKALNDKERELQEKIHQSKRGAPSPLKKDW